MSALIMPADSLELDLTRKGKSISGPVTTMRSGEGRYAIAGWVFAYHVPIATNIREPVSTLVVLPKGWPGPRLEGVVFRDAIGAARQWAIHHCPTAQAPSREPPDEIGETLLTRIRTLRRQGEWYLITASNNYEENEVGHQLFRIKPSSRPRPKAIYRRCTGPSDLLAELLPAWRLSAGQVHRAYFDSFLARNHPLVESTFAKFLGKLAVSRYLAAPRPSTDAYFVRDEWKQELRFEGDTLKARSLADEYKRQTGGDPGEGVEHRAGDFRAEWLSGDDEISIQGPVSRGEQRVLLARYGFASRGSEYIKRWLPPSNLRPPARVAAIASAVWTRARNVVDKLAAGDASCGKRWP